MFKHLHHFTLGFLICLITSAVTTHGQQRLSEITPYVALADQAFTESLRKLLDPDANGSWAPEPKQVMAAISRIHSESGERDLAAKARPEAKMIASIKRIRESRFQVFGLVSAGRKYLFIDATPLNSDNPKAWLTDCISCDVFDGGAAYWWATMDADTLEVLACGRRP